MRKKIQVSNLTILICKYRYFVVIDDIWNSTDWKMIKRALPGNNLETKLSQLPGLSILPSKLAVHTRCNPFLWTTLGNYLLEEYLVMIIKTITKKKNALRSWLKYLIEY
jgi:hypothetical protein